MTGQTKLPGLDWSAMGTLDIHDLILDDQPTDGKAPEPRPKAKAEDEWEIAFSSGADVAIRRTRGGRSEICALILAKGQYYLWDEDRGTRKPLTGARLASFFKSCKSTELIPWYIGKPGEIYAGLGSFLLRLLSEEALNDLLRRGLILLDYTALYTLASRRRLPAWLKSGGKDEIGRKAIISCLLQHYRKDDVTLILSKMLGANVEAVEGCYGIASLFGYSYHVGQLIGDLGLDSTRKLIEHYFDDSGLDAKGIACVADVAALLSRRSHAYEPKMLCRYALAHWEELQAWQDYIKEEAYNSGAMEGIYPRDPVAGRNEHRRRMAERRNQAIRQKFADRVAALGHKELEGDGYLIRLPRSSDELEAEGAALHHCVGTFVARHAHERTTIWLMRKTDEPDKPYITVEVVDRRVRQAHGLCNRSLDAAESRWLKTWCIQAGYHYNERGAAQVRG